MLCKNRKENYAEWKKKMDDQCWKDWGVGLNDLADIDYQELFDQSASWATINRELRKRF